MGTREQLAVEVARVLAARGWSIREAATQTGLYMNAVLDMGKGRHVSANAVTKWAVAIGEDPGQWLRWAGHDKVVRVVFPSDSPHVEGLTRLETPPAHPGNPIEDLLDAEERRAARARALWNGLPPAMRNWHELTHEQRERINQAIEEAMKEPPSEG